MKGKEWAEDVQPLQGKEEGNMVEAGQVVACPEVVEYC
jgi:hypothetical protein